MSAFGLDTFEYFTGTNLKDIYYAGTEEEWGRIVGKNKYDLVNVTMHYNYKMPKINEDDSEVSDNDGDIDKVIFTIGEKNSRVFGVLRENDVAPIIRNNRTMLPARAVAESLGGTVGWDENNKAVTVNGKNKNGEDVSLVINIGSDTAYVNGEAVTLDSPAFIENNRTYTPVRFIAENLGADVLWDGENQRVILER